MIMSDSRGSILLLFFARDALRDCQIHLDILHSSASALAGGVAQLSAVAVAARIVNAAAAVAAATRSAAMAVDPISSLSPNAYGDPAQLEALEATWLPEPFKQLHSQHGGLHRIAKPIKHAQDYSNSSRSYGLQSIADSGITVQDLEEGIAGLARSCPSSPVMPAGSLSSGRSRRGVHFSTNGGGGGHASLVLVTCGSRSPGTTNGWGLSKQDADGSSPDQRRERSGRGKHGVGGAKADAQ
jgi:hypothetical protein